MTSITRSFTYVLALLPLIFLFACNTLPESLINADSAFSQGNFKLALSLYEKTLSEKPSPEQAAHARNRMAESRKFLTDAALRDSRSLIGRNHIRDFEARLERLQSALQFDDADNRLAREIEAVQQALATHKLSLAQRNESLQASLSQGDWRTALQQLSEALLLEPDYQPLEALRPAIIDARDREFSDRIRRELNVGDTSKARELFDGYAALQPTPDRSILMALDRAILNTIEDQIPGQLRALIDQKRYYEALLLWRSSTRNSTQEDFSFIMQEGGNFYRETAESVVRRLGREGFGVAYFAAFAAYLLDPSNHRNFEINREYSDEIYDRIKSNIGIVTFDSPRARPDEGLVFTDTILTRFSQHLPFGLELVDRATMDTVLAQRESDRAAFLRERKVEHIIRGSVLEMSTVNNNSNIRQSGNYRREVRERNPEFSADARRRDPNIPEFITRTETLTHEFDVLVETLDISMEVSAQLVNAQTNQIVRLNGISQTRMFSDTIRERSESHFAQPLLNLAERRSTLPTTAQAERALRNRVAAQVVEFLTEAFAGREQMFVADYRHRLNRRETTQALTALASAHMYWLGTLEKKGLPRDDFSRELLEKALIQHARDLASFHAPPPVVAGRPQGAVAQAPAVSAERHYAVVVGISHYQDRSIPSLQYASRDAREFHRYLVDPFGGGLDNRDVILLLDNEATLSGMRVAINRVFRQANENDTVTIYFAGHGSPDSPERPDRLFLLPYDSNFEDIMSTAFPMDDLTRTLSDRSLARAGRITLFADACHSGGIGANFEIARRALVPTQFIDLGQALLSSIEELARENDAEAAAFNRRRSIAVITASEANETSQEGPQWGGGHGVFTYALLQGLRGQADLNQDGIVTLGEVIQFVNSFVERETSGKQNPVVSGQPDFNKVLNRRVR